MSGLADRFSILPLSCKEFMDWDWKQIEPYFHELEQTNLSTANLAEWLSAWTKLNDLLEERRSRLFVATSVDTTDTEAEKQYQKYLDEIYPQTSSADQKLKQLLLNSGLEPDGFKIALRNIKAEAELFREENIPLMTEDQKLGLEYDKIIGAQSVQWEGKEVTLQQLQPVYLDADRDRRERAWRASSERFLADREAINALWAKFLHVRRHLAKNAGLPDYRAYRWREMLRFDYTPENCRQFRDAIAEVVVPLATLLYEKRRRHLGLETLRPWDLAVDPLGREPLHPFADAQEFENGAKNIFSHVAPRFAGYFQTMRDEKLLDLENRKGKAPGGFCTTFPAVDRPYIFMNAVGMQNDVQTLLHEGGHAFHVFETASLPYHQLKHVGLEFAEVASMSMELLASPYLTKEFGGFYNEAEAARARIEHLEEIILFWPYMAVVDGFQHWVYENPDDAAEAGNCDRTWASLWKRFMPGVNWSGLDDVIETGWHRKLHIHQLPLYYVEYGLAQLGAVQVWRNALADQTGAVERYRQALSLGGTKTLPELYGAAGAKFAFSTEILREATSLLGQTIKKLEGN